MVIEVQAPNQLPCKIILNETLLAFVIIQHICEFCKPAFITMTLVILATDATGRPGV
jgi:hypothetical protein